MGRRATGTTSDDSCRRRSPSRRGLSVRVCARRGGADAPPPQPADRRGARTALGPGAFRTQAPPHDLVFIGVPNGVLRFRSPVRATPETHDRVPVSALAAAAREAGASCDADGAAAAEEKRSRPRR